MEFVTPSKGQYYPGYQLPLWFNREERFADLPGIENCYRLFLVKKGAGVIRLGEWRIIFMAPALFCFGETDHPELEKEKDLGAVGCYFHPSVVNNVLDLGNIHDHTRFSGSVLQDRYWLQSFFTRNEHYSGYLMLNPDSAKKVEYHIDCVCNELEAQRDEYWPCRSRSYFLELLMLVTRIYEQGSVETCVLDDSPGEMGALICYLHFNYGRKITVEELCQEFKLNRTTLAQRFNRATGFSVIAYLNKLRIRIATTILRDTALPMAEIAERTGFSDLTHFGRTFRKVMGVSPSKYREENCWMLPK